MHLASGPLGALPQYANLSLTLPKGTCPSVAIRQIVQQQQQL
jgi:hypothetical protein